MGIEYLHHNKICHRDLKPENLIFESSGYLIITDLGVAKVFEENKDNIDSSGTPGYMAPEVINNTHHNLTSDYFSLGVILYELMMGKVYFYNN
jgi:serine/threonine protein kinase